MYNSKVAEEVSQIDVPNKGGSERSPPASTPEGFSDVVMLKSTIGSIMSPRGIPKASSFACQALSSSDVGMLDMTIDEDAEQKLDNKVRLMRFSTAASNIEAMFESGIGSPFSGVTSTPDSSAPQIDSQDISSEQGNELHTISITQDDDDKNFNAPEELEEGSMQNDECPDIIFEARQPSEGTEKVNPSSQVSFVDPIAYEESNPESISEAGEEEEEPGLDLDRIVQQLNSMESEIITPWGRGGGQNIPTSPSIRFAPSIQQGKPITFPTHWNEIKAQAISSITSDRLDSTEAETRDRPRNRLLKAISIERISSFRKQAADNERGEPSRPERRRWSTLRRSTRTEEQSVPRSPNFVQKVRSIFRRTPL